MTTTQKSFSSQIGGKKLIIEVGKFAGQTNGSCTVQYGDTVVLATACLSTSIREGIDYFPLMVDFDEKLYVWKNLPDESGAWPDIVYDLSTSEGAFKH